MSLFRKKPIVIEAVQFASEPDRELVGFALGDEPEWYRVARTIDGTDEGSIAYRDGFLFIHTTEGVMRADYDDWIIRGIKGEIYPCKPDIFAATYEPVTPSQSASHGGLDTDV